MLNIYLAVKGEETLILIVWLGNFFAENASPNLKICEQ